ncbi:PREDICTED: serine/threonine-protein kinase 19 homolog isoform X2 [Tarenaya hassleriana]|uniref:serine/threonine-protein kinase 19 homolog isoform X2 n=1 Tax=Tarenaya hassleriana TaxID=28532 RepID=UPI00053C4132|nr:PREDICTED: serine/threonine-protein kinase 19 homolog isoform X2 [Tarenaya hassleriana]
MKNPDVGSSSRKKRRRDDEGETGNSSHAETEDQCLPLENNLTFSDTSVALRMMRAQFPRMNQASIQPFILQSQLYSSVNDRTQVDRELESLRREKVVRIFKLNTGQDDHAIMFLDDYLNQVDHIVKRMEEKKQNGIEVFEWFKMHVLDSKLEPSIGHHELFSLLSLGGRVKEEHITLLINAGLLTRQLIDPDMYWFAIPSIGRLLKGLSQGRKELLSILKRKKHKEMFLSELEKKQLRWSPLDMRFHLRDLIGSGHLKTIQTTSGLVVRVSRD